MFCFKGVVAFFVNLTSYWIIGNTSPLAYNVLGQLKLSLTLLGGFVLFDDPLRPIQLIGVITTLIGCMLYTHIKVRKRQMDFLFPSLNDWLLRRDFYFDVDDLLLWPLQMREEKQKLIDKEDRVVFNVKRPLTCTLWMCVKCE